MRRPHAIGALCAATAWSAAAPALSAATGARFGAPAVSSVREPLATGGGVLQVMLSLALVLAVIFVLGWLARRLRMMPKGRTGALRVMDEVAIGAKERAVILEVDGVRLVLGVGEGRVVLLHRSDVVTPASEATVAGSDAAPGAVRSPGFADLMNKALGR